MTNRCAFWTPLGLEVCPVMFWAFSLVRRAEVEVSLSPTVPQIPHRAMVRDFCLALAMLVHGHCLALTTGRRYGVWLLVQSVLEGLQDGCPVCSW